VTELHDLLRAREGWVEGIEAARALLDDRRDHVKRAVDGYGDVYKGRRAAMVVDVVASRQRGYKDRVLPMVARFERTGAAESLQVLGDYGPEGGLGLMSSEPETIKQVAAGLWRYCVDHELDEEAGVRSWAESVEPLRFMFRYDDYVGATKGVGVALFAYARMRSGADALKPDQRVRKSLTRLGFRTPPGDAELVAMAECVAVELGVSRLELDQLLL
jgi:hypothetical protein